MNNNVSNKTSSRILAVGLIFLLAFGVICARAVHLQVLEKADLAGRAQRQVEKSEKSNPRRGIIYDAAHRELAVSLEVTSVSVRPPKVKDKEKATRGLARALGVKESYIRKKINRKSSFVWLKRHASAQQVEKVKALEIPGIEFFPASRRFYPNQGLAGQVLGFCGVEGRGLEGLEYYFEDELSGESANWTVLKDALGRRFVSDKPMGLEKAGNNLILTIDRTIQTIAEDALAQAVEKSRAKSGIAVVMAPSTGAILAIAHVPLMNPNSFGSYGPELWRNRAVTDSYEPGSTMKVFLAAAALESGLVAPDTIFYCENGKLQVGRNTVHDVHEYGELSLAEIVKYSSNIGALKVGRVIGGQTLHGSLTGFGFGDRLGVDCPGEAKGALSHYSGWTEIDAGTIAFGQGVSVTALQLASAISALANEGMLMKPYLVQAVTDHRGRLVKNFNPTPMGRAVNPQNAEIVAGMMQTVVQEGGTGTQAKPAGWTACGKTGTAQKVSPYGGYARGKYIASFAGFTPVERPELAIVVLVDEPRGCHYGGVIAGPVFRTIAEKTLQYLDVPQSVEGANLASQAKEKDQA